MWRRRLNNKERMARLISGGMITGISLTGGLRTIPGKLFITTLGVMTLWEGLVNRHLLDYFGLKKLL